MSTKQDLIRDLGNEFEALKKMETSSWFLEEGGLIPLLHELAHHFALWEDWHLWDLGQEKIQKLRGKLASELDGIEKVIDSLKMEVEILSIVPYEINKRMDAEMSGLTEKLNLLARRESPEQYQMRQHLISLKNQGSEDVAEAQRELNSWTKAEMKRIRDEMLELKKRTESLDEFREALVALDSKKKSIVRLKICCDDLRQKIWKYDRMLSRKYRTALIPRNDNGWQLAQAVRKLNHCHLTCFGGSRISSLLNHNMVFLYGDSADGWLKHETVLLHEQIDVCHQYFQAQMDLENP